MPRTLTTTTARRWATAFDGPASTRTMSTAAAAAASTARDEYNAIVTRPPARALEEARRRGRPLEGASVSVKHNLLTANMPSTAASRMLSTHFQPHFDATAVRLLRDAGGASIVGKTNCDEFGMGSANVHSVYGPVINPAAALSLSEASATSASSLTGKTATKKTRRRVAGGSSGGAAAAARSRGCDLSLASDTGGSIRLPASYCGVWGLKPSYGRVSRWGLIAYADSLDTVGLLGSDLDNVIKGYHVLDRVDGTRDPTAVPRSFRNRAQDLVMRRLQHIGSDSADQPLAGLIVGVPREYFLAELSPAVVKTVRQTLSKLRAAGATLRSVSLPHTHRALGAYYVLASAEAASNLARYDGVRYGFRKDGNPEDLANGEHIYAATRSEGFGEEVQRRILLGTYALSAGAFDNYYLKAQRIRRLVQADFDRVFAIPNVLRSSDSDLSSDGTAMDEGVDVLVHPSAVDIAPLLPEDASTDTPSPNDTSFNAASYVQDVLTVPASLAGLPALSMPVGHADVDDGEGGTERWPIGVSVVAQWGCEEMLWPIARVAAHQP